MPRRSLPPQARSRGVMAVLGPTNTGKTHLAIERLVAHGGGMIGLPLRLLAREVYGRVVEKVGAQHVALVTGEEKIKPLNPRYWICTVEAMPRDLELPFVAVDEIQLAADLDRGHVFTDRLLNQRGREETLLIGAGTMRPLVEALIPGVHVVSRPRLSNLSFAGERKVSRLPPRTAIVAFSAEEVYAIAELIRRQRGGAAVVLGALSPRTRNAQVELYQNGDVDYLVATDAIGMGLNLDVDHVAFAADRKFDGFKFRKLLPAEIGQIAGRAGRYLRDGTFGTTGRCDPFDADVVQAVEDHAFEPLRILQWRNSDLDYSSLGALQESLAETPHEAGLTRAPTGEDVASLEIVAQEADVRDHARGAKAVERLWQVCQVPDYRKVSPAGHADLVATLYRFLMREGAVPADWFNRQLAAFDRTDGDIDTLANRIAQVRTWTFVANRPDWLADPEHWQGVTRAVEDRLSDALHERLASRFVDRRTSVLMRRLRENAMLEAEITATGEVTVEGQHVGNLQGFHFVPDPQAAGDEARTLRAAASKALAGEIEARAERFASAADTAFVLSNDGTVRWLGDPVAKLEPGETVLEPRFRILADEHLTGPARDRVNGRLRAWLKAHIVRLLGPVIDLENPADLQGLARGIGFQVAESLGVLERAKVLQDVRALDQEGRAALRQKGVRFGAYHLYLPALLKPAPRTLATQLWALKNGGLDQKGIDEIAHLAGSGRTSIPVDPEIGKGLYRAAGFRVCGARAVRVDILERLADLIRPAVAYRPGVTAGEPPPGTADGEGFVASVGMTSLVGTSGEDFASILRSLGYVMDRRPGPAITVPLVPAAPMQPAAPAAAPAAPEGSPGEAGGDMPLADAAQTIAEDASSGSERSPEIPAAPSEPVSLEPVPSEPETLVMPDLAAGEVAAPVTAAGAPPATPDPDPASPAAPEAIPAEAEAPAGDDAAPREAAQDGSPAPTDPDAAGATDSAPPEPILIEVWRQHRQHREDGQGRPRHRSGHRPAGNGRAPDRSATPQGERQPPGERPPRREDGRPRPAPGEPRREDRPRPDFRADEGGRPRREDRRPPRRDDQAPPRADDRRRDRAPDPNSPFAKLAALKAQLEGRNGDKH